MKYEKKISLQSVAIMPGPLSVFFFFFFSMANLGTRSVLVSNGFFRSSWPSEHEGMTK